MSRRRARAQEHARHVHRDDLVPVVEREIDGGPPDRDPRIVDEDVDPAFALGRRGEQRVHRVFPRDVGGVRPGAAAERANFRDRLGGSLGVEVRDDRYGAGVGQRQRGRATDPARAAGHDRDGAVHSRGARCAQPSFDPRAVTYIE